MYKILTKLILQYIDAINIFFLFNSLRARHFSEMHFLGRKLSSVGQTSNSATARSVGPNLKTKPLLEREFNALSYESSLPQTILNISEVMDKRVRIGILVSV